MREETALLKWRRDIEDELHAAERRRYRRSSMQIDGVIIVDSRRREKCIVANYSFGGAEIDAPEETSIPSIFILEITPLGWTRHAEVVWRQDDRIGVKFI